MVVRSEVGRLPYTRRQSEVVAVDEPAGRPFRSSIIKRRTRTRELAACPATAASRASALERELLPAPGRLHRDRVEVFQGQVVVTFHCVGRAGWHASRVALACAWPIRGRIRRRRNERTPSATSLTETGLTRSA